MGARLGDRGPDPARQPGHDAYFRSLAAAEPQRAATYLKQVTGGNKTDAELDIVYSSTAQPKKLGLGARIMGNAGDWYPSSGVKRAYGLKDLYREAIKGEAYGPYHKK